MSVKLPRRYEIKFTRGAERDLDKLHQDVQRKVLKALGTLADNPRRAGVTRMQGDPSNHKIRIGDYRALFTIEDAVLLVLVVEIGNRRDIYRKR